MKIVRIINSLGFGGAESQLVGLLPQLLNQGHQVIIITLLSKDNLISKMDKRAEYYSLNISNARSFLKGLRKLFGIIAREKPALIHSDLLQANLLARLVKFRFPKIKVINTTHCNYNLTTRSYNPYFLYRLTSKWVDLHTAVSKPALAALITNKSISAKKSKLVLNAIDTAAFKGNTTSINKPFRWIAIGRLIKDKDYKTMLDATKHLISNKAGFSLDIYGEGAERDDLEAYRKSFDFNNQIHFLGVTNNIAQKLSFYHGFIISSQNEALPMALLEAMASGLPVVATDVGEIKEIITAANGGMVVEPKNPVALAKAMTTLMDLDKNDLELLGTSNLKYVNDTCSSTIIAKEWNNIYESFFEPGSSKDSRL